MLQGRGENFMRLGERKWLMGIEEGAVRLLIKNLLGKGVGVYVVGFYKGGYGGGK